MRRLISALAFFIAARSDDAISVALRLRPHDAGVLFESSCTAAAEIVVTGAPDVSVPMSTLTVIVPPPLPDRGESGQARFWVRAPRLWHPAPPRDKAPRFPGRGSHGRPFEIQEHHAPQGRAG